jgi:cell wall-associated NlpC family hydrolase
MFRRLALTALPTTLLAAGAALVVAPIAASPVAVVSESVAAPRNPEAQMLRPWVEVVSVAAPRNPEGHALRPWVPIAESKPTVADLAVSHALEAVGVPYRYGGESTDGFDCSGLVRWSYRRVGIDVPHNSYALYSVGRQVPTSRMKPGDVLFFEGLGHVGLYVGKGRMVHAPYTGKDVEVVSLEATNYGERLIGARRVGQAAAPAADARSAE